MCTFRAIKIGQQAGRWILPFPLIREVRCIRSGVISGIQLTSSCALTFTLKRRFDARTGPSSAPLVGRTSSRAESCFPVEGRGGTTNSVRGGMHHGERGFPSTGRAVKKLTRPRLGLFKRVVDARRRFKGSPCIVSDAFRRQDVPCEPVALRSTSAAVFAASNGPHGGLPACMAHVLVSHLCPFIVDQFDGGRAIGSFRRRSISSAIISMRPETANLR
jgi:hypothetical protein